MLSLFLFTETIQSLTEAISNQEDNGAPYKKIIKALLTNFIDQNYTEKAWNLSLLTSFAQIISVPIHESFNSTQFITSIVLDKLTLDSKKIKVTSISALVLLVNLIIEVNELNKADGSDSAPILDIAALNLLGSVQQLLADQALHLKQSSLENNTPKRFQKVARSIDKIVHLIKVGISKLDLDAQKLYYDVWSADSSSLGGLSILCACIKDSDRAFYYTTVRPKLSDLFIRRVLNGGASAGGGKSSGPVSTAAIQSFEMLFSDLTNDEWNAAPAALQGHMHNQSLHSLIINIDE